MVGEPMVPTILTAPLAVAAPRTSLDEHAHIAGSRAAGMPAMTRRR